MLRYRFFKAAVIAPDPIIDLLNFYRNRRNSSCLSFYNKYILNSYISDGADDGYLCNFILMKYFFDFVYISLLLRGVGVGLTCNCIAPDIQLFLWDTLFIIVLLVLDYKHKLPFKLYYI